MNYIVTVLLQYTDALVDNITKAKKRVALFP